jgi:hypothetical protein
MPFAIGGRLLLHSASRGNWTFIVAAVILVLIFRFWPAIVSWWERRR